jgi:hypothetical protein
LIILTHLSGETLSLLSAFHSNLDRRPGLQYRAAYHLLTSQQVVKMNGISRYPAAAGLKLLSIYDANN